jgi:hypothetical protein
MNADVLLTIAFSLYAVLVAVGAGLVIARAWNEPAFDEAAEKRFTDLPARRGGRRAMASAPTSRPHEPRI